MDLDRRGLLKGALLAAAGGTVACAAQRTDEAHANHPAAKAQPASDAPERPWDVIDTNLSLFQWPFRRLPYDVPGELDDKLRSLGIGQAWAGSFEGLLHRDVAGVNARLAEACRRAPELLVPFGTVNPQLPDFEEDLRRCHEMHRMPGIRLHPNYHGYTLNSPQFEQVLTIAAARGLLVQLAASMEDGRTQHTMLQVPDVDLSPLPEVMRRVPQATVLLLNHRLRGDLLTRLAQTPRLHFDTARVEGTSGIAGLVRHVPRGRVTFGTHAPFFIYESALIKVYESELTDDESRAVFAQNARDLLPDRA